MSAVLQVAATARAGYPPSYAICGLLGSCPKSMYSISDGISETDVKNRVHPSSSSLYAPRSSLGQLSAGFADHGVFLPASVPGIPDRHSD